MTLSVTVEFGGHRYVWDGQRWYDAADYTIARASLLHELDQLVPAASRRRIQRSVAGKGAVHRWALDYDPKANAGRGALTARIGEQTAVCNLAEGHRADGATFNRFGLLTVMKSADGGGEVWLDDITINGQTENFDQDPGWEGFQNRRSYETTIVRPQFDFGFSQIELDR